MKRNESKQFKFLAKALGQETLETLVKSDLYKIKTDTVASLDEMFIGMKLVPQTIIAMLRKELHPLKDGESKKVKLPTDPVAILSVTKFAADVYSGEIIQDGRIIATFKYRTIPGIGLVVMSTFELYNVADLTKPSGLDHEKEMKIQQEIEEAIRKKPDQAEPNSLATLHGENNHGKPLKDFLDNKEKVKKSYQVINLSKSGTVSCPDCGQQLIGNGVWSSCVCLGQDRNKKVYLKKSEDGSLKVSFSRGWDQENIALVLEALRQKKGK